MTLLEFAREMEKKLHDNEHKGHWDGCDPRWLLRRLKQETGELDRAMKQAKGPGTARFVVEEAADVANFAMMIADIMSHPDFYAR